MSELITEQTKEPEVKLKMLLLGMSLAFVVNLIYISNMFAVGKMELRSGELCFVKGIIQTIIFGLAALHCRFPSILHKKRIDAKRKPNCGDYSNVTADWKPICIILAYGMSNSLVTIFAYMALRMLPLSDVVVFGHTGAIFTLILSRFFLRTRISLSKATFCILMLLGIVLVAKPTFIFGSAPNMESNCTNTNNYNGTDEDNSLCNGFSEEIYALGVILSLSCAFTAAIGHITSVQSKQHNIPNNVMMISAGILTVLVSFFTPVLGLENRFLDSTRIYEILFYPGLLLLIGIGLGSITGGLMLILANQKSPPTVVSIVRSSEIVLALFIDHVILGITGHGYFAVIGSVLVLLSVVGMAGSHWVDEKMTCTKPDLESAESSSNPNEDLEENFVALMSDKR